MAAAILRVPGRAMPTADAGTQARVVAGGPRQGPLRRSGPLVEERAVQVQPNGPPVEEVAQVQPSGLLAEEVAQAQPNGLQAEGVPASGVAGAPSRG